MPLALFYSYSHADEPLRDELDMHLALLRRRGVISPWHERRVAPDMEWRAAIDAHVDRAHLILLLVSPDFLASDYCSDAEISRAMARHRAGAAVVVPVIAQPVDLDGSPFAALPPLPQRARPVTGWPMRDAAWTEVAKGVRHLAESLGRSLSARELPSESADVHRAIARAHSAGALPAATTRFGALAAGAVGAEGTAPVSVLSPERRADIALERALAGFQEEMVEAMRARAPGEALRPAASWRLGERIAGIADWKCILWVEDEPAHSRFERAALHRLQIELVTATSTRAALALLGDASRRFDLVVSNWTRPGPDPDAAEGLRLLHAMRAHDIAIPVVIYDAVPGVRELSTRNDLVRAAGGQGALARPDALFDRIAALLGG